MFTFTKIPFTHEKNNYFNSTFTLYRYFSPSAGEHFYTADRRELGRGFEGYHLEGVTGYVYKR